MTINTQETVGQLASALPGATRVFEQFGIDYCCGGQRTLSEACQLKHLAVERVIHSLAEAEASRVQGSEERDWHSEMLTTLAAYIVDTHHFFTKQESTRLENLIAKVCQAHGDRHPELLKVQALFQELKQDLLPHMLKEEQVLFPYVARLEEANYFGEPTPQPFFGTVNNPVQMMMAEHDRAGELLRALRELTSDYADPGNACASYRALYRALPEFEADLHQHIHLENNILFPRAVALEAQTAPERQQASSEYRCLGH